MGADDHCVQDFSAARARGPAVPDIGRVQTSAPRFEDQQLERRVHSFGDPNVAVSGRSVRVGTPTYVFSSVSLRKRRACTSLGASVSATIGEPWIGIEGYFGSCRCRISLPIGALKIGVK
ncbi:hypothetical protein CH300_27830 [Rhodococcus sp. 15-1154-1]|nr:hypothetical protein CH300_27830 [Rhodococcus sp. 15-1154-1]